jgi:hypothetical protein
MQFVTNCDKHDKVPTIGKVFTNNGQNLKQIIHFPSLIVTKSVFSVNKTMTNDFLHS